MKGWNFVSLSEACSIKPPKKEAKTKLSSNDLVSFVPMNNIGICTKNIDLNEDRPLGKVYGSYTYFADGDVILAKITPCFENGKLGIANGLTNGIGFGSSEYVVFRSKCLIDPEYLFYFLSQNTFREAGAKVMTGAVGHKRIPKDYIENQKIPLPPLPEQKQIVAILDEMVNGIEEAAINAEKNLTKLRELFESYLVSAFSNDGKVWGTKSLGDVCENLDSRRIPITKAKRTSGGVPYYGASGVVDYVEDYIFDEDLLLVSEDGANLLARTYPIAFSISGKSWVNNHAHVLRFQDLSSQRFIEYYLNSISLEPYVSGMAQPKLNQKALNSIQVPFPKLKEQEILVGNLDELSDKNQCLESIYKNKLAALAELKQSILQKAFAGELTSDFKVQHLEN